MSQTYVTVSRKNLQKPADAPKFYAVGRSGRKVSIKEVCERISERSSFSKGELEGCITEYLLEVLHVLSEGNIAQIGDLGNFRMTIKTGKPTATAEEFRSSCIASGRVVFYPGLDLRKLCKTMQYTAYKNPDEADDTGGESGGGSTGGGGGDLPDPKD